MLLTLAFGLFFLLKISISWCLSSLLAFEGCNFVFELQDLVLMVLVSLLDIRLILVHTLLQLILVVQIVLQLLLLLNIREHNFHVEIVLTTSFSLVKLFRDQGGVALASVGTIVPRMRA